MYFSDVMHAKHWGDFCEPDSDANQFKVRSTILKQAGSRGAALVGGVGDRSPPPNLFFQLTGHFHGHIFFFKSGQIYMIYAECSGSKEKSYFRFFQYIFIELWSFLHWKWYIFDAFHHNSKNRNRKNLKYDFSLFSVDCASLMRRWPLLMRGAAAYP